MKKIKFGFSLAELLIALSIISIVSVLGITITKRSVENAYNAYYYAGYKGIYEALLSSRAEENIILSGNLDNNRTAFETIANIFDEDTSATPITNNGILTNVVIQGTSNGIIYDFSYRGLFSLNNPSTGNPENYHFYNIDMTIPSVQKSTTINNTKYNIVGTTTRFLFAPEYRGGLLMPIDGAISRTDNNNRTTTKTINLQERPDLLTFFIDDNTVGRVIYRLVTNPDTAEEEYKPTFTPRTFESYKDAYCRLYGSSLILIANNVSTTVCSCEPSSGLPGGTIAFENPRKAF